MGNITGRLAVEFSVMLGRADGIAVLAVLAPARAGQRHGELDLVQISQILIFHLIFLPSENACPTFSPKFQYAWVTPS